MHDFVKEIFLFVTLSPFSIQEVVNMAKPMKAETIANSNFPLYSVRMVGDRHFLITGGGGQAKTGVLNAFVSI